MTEGLEVLRDAVALVAVAGSPAVLSAWLWIHPFAGFWRRAGAGWAYAAMAAHVLAVSGTLLAFRGALLPVRVPAPGWTVLPAAALFAASASLARARSRAMPFGTLLGRDELAAGAPGRLVTAGPYARLRHPRYAEGVLALAAAALFTGRAAVYAVAAAFAALAAGVAAIEERELRRRFGAVWDAYAARVPRFVPLRFRRCGPAVGTVGSPAEGETRGDEQVHPSS